MSKKTFASDNYAGVHPQIMNALLEANVGHSAAYGGDHFTEQAIARFKQLLGQDIEVFFVYNGTGANVLGLSAATSSFHAIICSELSHIRVDESTAPQKFTGCTLATIPTKDGKIYPGEIEKIIKRLGDQHHPQYKVISISQPTEYGTLYSIGEIKAISDVAKKYNFYFHMDGARIANAAVGLQKDIKAFTAEAGIDILSFGGTKNGMMFGEAIVFFNSELAKDFIYYRKQAMQLHSKMRFIGAQFSELLTNDLWKKIAQHANNMASHLKVKLEEISAITITQAVEANAVFAIFPKHIIPPMQEEFFFYVWDETINEVRLMCSFDTTAEEIRRFVEKLKKLISP